MYLIFLARQRYFFITGGPKISHHQLSPVLPENKLYEQIETILCEKVSFTVIMDLLKAVSCRQKSYDKKYPYLII